ncbi:hypothetical protein COV20_02595 [Candidatus Woesearchaeota archaeon CG10_big_fil_rev_8_21_14_0_10_45_16]|nr:MAG: hypothetical protein COV20_02595 [Candidatus Woesearchaeota archaeon CG10_big_fil_rev_8_21_14_0_10_45_16]
MSQEKLLQLREQLSLMERRLKPLEWDLGRNQINEFKKRKLEQLRVEMKTLSQELHDLESQ